MRYSSQNNSVKSLLRNIIPASLKHRIDFYRNRYREKKNFSRFIKFYSKEINHHNDPSIIAIRNFIKEQGFLSVFPYNLPYLPETIEVFFDGVVNLHFVMQNGRKLFFPQNMSPEDIKNYYAGLQVEQSIESPHRYIDGKFTVTPGDTILDIGATEGFFALNHIEQAKHVYLIETNPLWINALRATYKPWENKVTIINKFITDRPSNEHEATIDSLFEDVEINFIKADIEGFEIAMVNGAKQLMEKATRLRMALCVYHNQNDFDELSSMLKGENFQLSHSDGYMIFIHSKTFEPPYLRRGILRAEK